MENNNQKNRGLEWLAKLITLVVNNFRIFVSEIIGLNNAPFHNDIDDCLSCELNKKICIALPRDHGKSTHLSVAYPLWEIGKNHNIRILLVSSTAETSKRFMSEIIGHIEQNKKYFAWTKAIDPSGKGVIPKKRKYNRREENWTGESIIIDRDDLRIKDPTINAVGLFGSILSRRADIVIVDDLVDQQNSATEEQRQKIKDWVYTTLMPVLVPGGRFIYLGNTWNSDDLISNLLKDPQFDVKKRISAIIHEAHRQDLWEEWANFYLDETLPPEEKKSKAEKFYTEHKKEMDDGVEVLWHERYPYSELYLKRLSNPYSFSRMYQCDPSIRPNQKFSEVDIEKALHKGRNLILQDDYPTEYQADCTVSGLDLAISQKIMSSDTALLTLDRVKTGNGDIKTGDYVIRNIERGKFSPNDVRERVIRHYYKVKPIGIRVESVAYQESMAIDLGDKGIPVRSYHTGGEKNDPDIGVNSLAILLSQGKLILPYSNKDARTRQLITQLVNEMREYPEAHTGDSLMALWFAFSEMRENIGNNIWLWRVGSPVLSTQNNAVELNKNPEPVHPPIENDKPKQNLPPQKGITTTILDTRPPWEKGGKTLKELERDADLKIIEDERKKAEGPGDDGERHVKPSWF